MRSPGVGCSAAGLAAAPQTASRLRWSSLGIAPPRTALEERRQIELPKVRIEQVESKNRLENQNDEDRPDGHLGASNRGFRHANSERRASRRDRDRRGHG